MDLSVEAFVQLSRHVLDRLRYMFYLVLPSESMFPEVQVVPRLLAEMFPFILLLAVAENGLRLLSGKSMSRMNVTLTSASQGIFQECLRIKVRSFEIIMYCLFYDYFRLWTLPWDSLWTWWTCFFLVDFGYYWGHRIAHEVNFIWAVHQAHHSAEEYTISSSGLRMAVLQPFTAWLTYWPLALLGIPPSVYLTHFQLSEIYMLWVHTELVPKMGPLEYFFNTPSNHRVHHARNRKYIDKNYGGIFIFWDRIFKTYEEEDPNDPPVYGLVHPVKSFNPFFVQFHPWPPIFQRIRDTPGLGNKIKVLLCGPGWDVGKPRMGHYHEIPEVENPVVVWDPRASFFEMAYVLVHFPLVIVFYHELAMRNVVLSQGVVTLGIISLITSITCLGFIIEKRWFAPILEFFRCTAFFAVERVLWPVMEFNLYRHYIVQVIRTIFVMSAIGSLTISACRLRQRMVKGSKNL